MRKFPKTLFITATDTDVGKTFISALLCQGFQNHGMQGHYWKPLQSGNTFPTDTQWIEKNTSLPKRCFLKEGYLTKEPLSPHLSSRLENIQITLDTLPLPSQSLESNFLLIEGCGGLLVPLNDQDLLIDLLKKWHIPSLIVARSTLGTINHTLLTLSQLKQYNLPIFGVVLNGPVNLPNKEAIEHFGKIPVLAQIPFQEEISPQILQNLFDTHFGKYL